MIGIVQYRKDRNLQREVFRPPVAALQLRKGIARFRGSFSPVVRPLDYVSMYYMYIFIIYT